MIIKVDALTVKMIERLKARLVEVPLLPQDDAPDAVAIRARDEWDREIRAWRTLIAPRLIDAALDAPAVSAERPPDFYGGAVFLDFYEALRDERSITTTLARFKPTYDNLKAQEDQS